MKSISAKDLSYDEMYGIKISENLKKELGLTKFNFIFGKACSGQKTSTHSHIDRELIVALSGNGIISNKNTSMSISPGEVVLLENTDFHSVACDGTDEFLFLDLYWSEGSIEKPTELEKGTKYIFSPPLTPNGDMHLGHLSGPYLAADVLKRYYQLCGNKAYHICGSDDYQSYVEYLAEKDGGLPESVCKENSGLIRKSLLSFNVETDRFLETFNNHDYMEFVTSNYNKLRRELQTKDFECFYDESGKYFHEAYISGKCPSCNEGTNGNICEGCGHPNVCVDLVDPMSNLKNSHLKKGSYTSPSINVSEFQDVVIEHLIESGASPRLLSLAKSITDQDGLELALEHPGSWGVQSGQSESVIWVWVCMLYGFLYSISKLESSESDSEEESEIIHCFGFDNSFYYSILYPIIYSFDTSNWNKNIRYVNNEFYLLEGMKFSTSRKHAIWASDILNENTSDLIRYYLLSTRPQVGSTNLTINTLIVNTELFKTEVHHEVVNTLLLLDTGSATPSHGLWLQGHYDYLNKLELISNQYKSEIESSHNNLTGLIMPVEQLISELKYFKKFFAPVMDDCEYSKTTMVLMLSTINLLSVLLRPIMPNYSDVISKCIGLVSNWDEKLDLLEGCRIDTAGLEDHFDEGLKFIKEIGAEIYEEL